MIKFATADVTIHPTYRRGTPLNDIAVVRLSTPTKFGTMPLAKAAPLAGAAAVVAGYGYTGVLGPTGVPTSAGFPTQLQAAPIPIVMADPCEQLWGALYDSKQHICAGTWTGMADSCAGDSGGPLALLSPAGMPAAVAGIVSFGNGCSQYGYYAVYTRVSAFMAWLTSLAPNAVSTGVAVSINPSTGASVCTHALIAGPGSMAALNCGANAIASIQLSAYSALPTPCGAPGNSIVPALQTLQRYTRTDCARASAGVPVASKCVGNTFCEVVVPANACANAPAFVVVATCANSVGVLFA